MMSSIVKVRMLLRVSSKQQLDADGDLPAQRRIVEGYIRKQSEWRLDEIKPEYHEFGVSGYKNTVSDRVVLNEIMQDAKNHEFHILVCYKDDRLGRREDEIPAYIKELAASGVLVYTVKEGCITPKSHTDDLMTYIRYWSAQGDSMKTAQRVKDSAMEQVRMGKNQGGKAPFGYRLELSGELSKHQRALKKKVIVPKEAEIVKKIYNYALTYGYGAYKIAAILNKDAEYRKMARNGIWKAGTINDMLKNPIYTGYETYNRRVHNGRSFHRLNRKEWVMSEQCNEEIKILDINIWKKVQNMREERKAVYSKRGDGGKTPVSTTGRLPLIDVIYCGYCGRKMTNGSKYNYWTTKDGKKHSSITCYYRCQAKHQGETCKGKAFFRADNIEEEVYCFIRKYLNQIEDNNIFLEKLQKMHECKSNEDKIKLKRMKRQLEECVKNQSTYESNLPLALRGEISIPVSDYYGLIEKEKGRYIKILSEIKELEHKIKVQAEMGDGVKKSYLNIPSWPQVFDDSEPYEKKIIINKLIERIDVKVEEIKISFKVNIEHTEL